MLVLHVCARVALAGGVPVPFVCVVVTSSTPWFFPFTPLSVTTARAASHPTSPMATPTGTVSEGLCVGCYGVADAVKRVAVVFWLCCCQLFLMVPGCCWAKSI